MPVVLLEQSDILLVFIAEVDICPFLFHECSIHLTCIYVNKQGVKALEAPNHGGEILMACGGLKP
jgi:hypothetical protein